MEAQLVFLTPKAREVMERVGPRDKQQLGNLLQGAREKLLRNNSLPRTESILAKYDLFPLVQMGKMIIASPHDIGSSDNIENIFNSGLQVVTKEESGRRGLAHFLTEDRPDQVYARIWPINRGCIDFGAQGTAHWIYGLGGSDLLYTAIFEAKAKTLEKVLYGWFDRANWGEIDYANVYYILSRLNGTGWQVLARPLTDVSRSPVAEAKAETARLVRFLLNKSKGNSFCRDFTVIHTEDNDRITYAYQGRKFDIYGFKGYDRVRLEAREHETEPGKFEMLGTFYGYQNGDLDPEPLGTYRLSKKSGQRYELCQPEPVSAVSPASQSRFRTKLLKDFIQQDQAEGAELELGQYYVYKNGFIRLMFDRLMREVAGLKRFAGGYVTATLRQTGDQKILYLKSSGPDPLLSQEAPIKPAGDLVAERLDGRWQFIEKVSDISSR